MKKQLFMSLITAAALIATMSLSSPVSAHGGRPLHATLTGAAEVPGPGDPDATGQAWVTLNPGQGEICYKLQVANLVLPAAAAHIHVGASGVAGPVVVGLSAPDASGHAEGCITGVDRDLVRAIIQNPGAYYVNVHNSPYPAGAARGQLSK